MIHSTPDDLTLDKLNELFEISSSRELFKNSDGVFDSNQMQVDFIDKYMVWFSGKNELPIVSTYKYLSNVLGVRYTGYLNKVFNLFLKIGNEEGEVLSTYGILRRFADVRFGSSIKEGDTKDSLNNLSHNFKYVSWSDNILNEEQLVIGIMLDLENGEGGYSDPYLFSINREFFVRDFLLSVCLICTKCGQTLILSAEDSTKGFKKGGEIPAQDKYIPLPDYECSDKDIICTKCGNIGLNAYF